MAPEESGDAGMGSRTAGRWLVVRVRQVLSDPPPGGSKIAVKAFHRFCEATSRRDRPLAADGHLTDSFVPSDGSAVSY